VERLPSKSYPKWNQELFEMALSYYIIGLSSGIEMMPVNLGLFGLSIECLANVRYGKQNNYATLGEGRYKLLINERLKKYKKNPTYREQAKNFGKQLLEEFELLTSFRNNYYGHSLAHKKEVKKELTARLRSLYIRQGYETKYVRLTFRAHRIHEDIATEAHNIYKLGLKLNRLFFFYHLGITRDIPFASKDWEC
jgi:hypothetical protein